MKLRSALYRAARLMGDAEAIRQGPRAIVKRQVRKRAYRTSARGTSALMRRIGAE